MNILEKLNIPGDLECENGWYIKSKNKCVATCDENIGKLLAASPKMLRTDIKALQWVGCEYTDYCDWPEWAKDKLVLLVETTGKPWEEIKSLMED